MTDREIILLDAIEGMTRQYPVYDDGVVYGLLVSDENTPDRENKLLDALVRMVDVCLPLYDDGTNRYDDGVDTLAQSAGTHAVLALSEFGLMERFNARLARWTPAGLRFLAEHWETWPSREAEMEAKAQSIERRRRLKWMKLAGVAALVVVGSALIGWLMISSLKAS
jgi:hypothetical protein